MRVSKLTAPKKIELFDEPMVREPGTGEARIKVKAVGICGTDLHIFLGERSDVELPRVMGHELSGIVEKVGEGVTNVKAGDCVVFDPVVACGTCKTCKSGHENVCADVKCFGVQMDGGFQDYIVVDAKKLYKYPDTIPFEEAALAEPFSVAANILTRVAAAAKDRIVIIGAGTIGLAILQAAKGMGASVLISDVEDKKLKIAGEFGADATVNSKKQNLAEQVMAFAPDGADVLIDAVGIAPLTEQTIDMASPVARIAVIGFDSHPMQLAPVSITKRELTLVGSRMNNGMFPKVVEWLEKGCLNTAGMVTRAYPVEEIQRAFTDTLANSDSTVKTIIKF
ncbi:MAG: alcohol dehydrogenase catalytic domain-containing protein [Lachnospiraceae bacterium]|nr:alcohol dehydrogenase catalytic domain-containing protein [Lachnospiraceae bacterium]